jgi:signal recognition particle GTPase
MVALRRQLDVPVRFLGRGENAEDLEVFDSARFADELLEE